MIEVLAPVPAFLTLVNNVLLASNTNVLSTNVAISSPAVTTLSIYVTNRLFAAVAILAKVVPVTSNVEPENDTNSQKRV